MLDQQVGCGPILERPRDDSLNDAFSVNHKVVEGHSFTAVGFGRCFIQVDGERKFRFRAVFDFLQAIRTFFFLTKNKNQLGIQSLEISGLFLQLDQLPKAVRSPICATKHQGDICVTRLKFVR